MPEGNRLDIDYDKFAQYTVERWQTRIAKMGIIDTGQLYRSFVWHVYRDSNGDIERMVFTFKLYGWYVERGVGKGYRRGNGGNLEFLANKSVKHRQKRRWYSPQMWHEMKRLAELVGKEYGEKALNMMKLELLGLKP